MVSHTVAQIIQFWGNTNLAFWVLWDCQPFTRVGVHWAIGSGLSMTTFLYNVVIVIYFFHVTPNITTFFHKNMLAHKTRRKDDIPTDHHSMAYGWLPPSFNTNRNIIKLGMATDNRQQFLYGARHHHPWLSPKRNEMSHSNQQYLRWL